jgi:hypothetical protein
MLEKGDDVFTKSAFIIENICLCMRWKDALYM